MSFSKDVGEISARYRPVDEVPSLTYRSGTQIRFTAPGSAAVPIRTSTRRSPSPSTSWRERCGSSTARRGPTR
jgi:hypothetical protein